MSVNLRQHFTGQLESMVQTLTDLVLIEAPTHEKAAVDEVGARLKNDLREMNAALPIHRRSEVGDIIEASWNADRPGRPIVILCHMDTVHPIGSLARNPVRVEDGQFYGPGAYDMKGGIVAALYALKGLIAHDLLPNRPVYFLLTSDEETGSENSRDLIIEKATGAALVLVMEPAMPDGSVKTWRKTVGSFNVRTIGKASHAGGAHEVGINAIEEMAHQVLALQRLTDYKRGSTVSVGMAAGGTARNTVPDQCEASIDCRALTVEEVERMTQAILGLKPVLPGAKVEVIGGFDRPPMERNEQMIRTFEQAKEIAGRYGVTLRESGTGGASDGNYTAGIGTPTLDGLGPTGDGAHSERENITIPSLAISATQIAALVAEWGE
jgi:glutamate carboxypeptidase